LPFIRSQRRDVITEAAYHFIQAARINELVGDTRGYVRCRGLLTDLTAAFNPATWQVVRFAGQMKLDPPEPFVEMGRELLSSTAYLPSDSSVSTLIRFIARRLDQLIVHRKQERHYALHNDTEELAGFAAQLVIDVSKSQGGNRPMESTISEILEHGQIRRLIKDKELLHKFREVISEQIKNESADLTTIRPDILHEAIAETYPESNSRSVRLELYERIYANSHLGYANLFLAMLGATTKEEEAEVLFAKYIPSLGQKAIRYITTLEWKKTKKTLLEDLRRGYDRFEMFHSDP